MHTLVKTLCLLGLAAIINPCQSPAQSVPPGDWYLSSISVPRNLEPEIVDPIIVAVVDDGMRITHELIQSYLWKNEGEIADNGVDDDGNGYIDDIGGWDLSDRDGDVTPPSGREGEYYHGTHLAGIIVKVVEAAFGDSAADVIRIMPIKCVSDLSGDFYLRDGYKGVEYAIDAGADIVLTAWGAERLETEERQILEKAAERGVLIVASGGNVPEEREQHPAAFKGVFAVAALGPDGVKIENSNYGAFIDIGAPGIDIRGAASTSDDGYDLREGSSFAAAIAAGAAAVLKARLPDYSWPEIVATLKNSAAMYPDSESDYALKLGAGRLDIGNALKEPIRRTETPFGSVTRPQGFLRSTIGREVEWRVEPTGLIHGIRFSLFSSTKHPPSGKFAFYTGSETKPVAHFSASDFPVSVFVPGASARVVALADPGGELIVEYAVDPIDLRTLYCEGTRSFDVEGSFGDGSGPQEYANNCDCKWIISAPEGKVIRIVIEEFDTESVVDKLYFFHGAGTHEPIMAIFSGDSAPKELVTWGNQVLLWFVTDNQNRYGGWQVSYTFIDP